MSGKPLRTGTVVTLITLLLGGCLTESGTSGEAPGASTHRPPGRAGVPVPAGAPSAAYAEYRSQRLPLDATIDTIAAYRRAETRAAQMARYSSALDRRFGASEWQSHTLRAELKGKWKSLGPGNVGGRTRRLLIDPRNPATLFAGGVSGGVWKSTDRGGSWRPTADELANVAVNAMVMSPANPDVLYVGTGEGYFREDIRGTGLPLRGGGVFASRDGGDSWARLPGTDGEDFWFVNDLVISVDGRRIYAATRTGVHRTTDDGQTWQRVLKTRVQGGCLDLAMRTDRNDDVIFASCGTFEQATVYRSLDGAAPVPDFVPVLSDPGMGRTSLALAPSDQDVVYALSASNDPGLHEQALHAVFRSTAGGGAGSWAARIRNTNTVFEDTLLLHNAVIARLGACNFTGSEVILPMGWYANAIAVDPTDPDMVWVAGVDWFRSPDGGQSWGPASFWWAGGANPAPSYTHADQHGMFFDPDYDGGANQTVYINNDGGVWRSDNARANVTTGTNALCTPASSALRWTSLNNNLGITQFYHGLPFASGNAVWGGTQDNGTQLRDAAAGANGWTRVLGGDGGYVAIDPRNPNVLYAESQNGNIAKSLDGGASFAAARNGLPPVDGQFLSPRSSFVFIPPILLDLQAPDTLWTGAGEMYRSDDGASRWRQASRKLKGRATAISIAPGDSDRVAVGTELGFVHTTDIGRRADAATTWPRKRPRKAWVTSVAHDPSDADVLYATYGGFGGNHVFRREGGGRWRAIDGEGADALPDIPVHTLVVDPNRPERLFIGTDLGVFVSTDRGESWAHEIAGFGQIVTEWLVLQREGKSLVLYAFTHGRGAWKSRVRP